MPKPTTAADLAAALGRYARACKALGLIPPGKRIVMAEGSRINGRAYRVALSGIPVTDAASKTTWPNGSGHDRPPVGDDFLGMTKTEARAALLDRAEALETDKIRQVFELVAQIARLTDPTDADNDDNFSTLYRLIDDARDITGAPSLGNEYNEDETEA